MPQNEERQEVDVNIAGNKFRWAGFHFGNVLQLAILGVMVAGGYLIIDVRAEQKAEHIAIAEVMKQQAKAMEKQVDVSVRQAQAQEEFNYLITMDQKQRERLDLRMPESLRAKMGIFNR